MTLSTRETHGNHHAAGAISRFVERLGLNGQRGARDRRHALAELAAMEDWQLEDLGLTRQRLERDLAVAGMQVGGEPQMHAGPGLNRNG